MQAIYLGKSKLFNLIFDEYSKHRPDIENYNVTKTIPNMQSEFAEKLNGFLGTNCFVVDKNRFDAEAPDIKEADLWLVTDSYVCSDEPLVLNIDEVRNAILRWLNGADNVCTGETGDTLQNTKTLGCLLNSTVTANIGQFTAIEPSLNQQRQINSHLHIIRGVSCDILWHKREDFILSAAEMYLGDADGVEYPNRERYWRYARLIHNALYANSVTDGEKGSNEIERSNIYMLKEMMNYALVIKYLKTLSEPIEFSLFLREFVERYNAMNPNATPLSYPAFSNIRKLLRSQRKSQI